jgi:glycosyltransferase involved in cell wall biosynthesis
MKYVVVHSGARDLYKVAETLFKNDRLGFLVTDDYFFRKEYRKLFPASRVKIPLRALFFRCILQVFKGWDSLHRYKDYYLGRCAGKLSQKYNMPLLAYSEYAHNAYKFSNIHPRILFQFHPHAASNRNIYLDEIKKHPEMKDSLLQETEMEISPCRMKKLIDETKQSDVFIAASSFTKDTLIENGADPNNIFVAPYGVDINKYPYKVRDKVEKVRFAFVGSYTERKGIYYLLSAAKELEEEGYNFELFMTGKAKFSIDNVNDRQLKCLQTYTNLSHNELINMLHNSNVFVFPSLVEGFAFVIIEAMSTGLPIISTTRTAGRDVVENEKEGFTILPSDKDSLKKAMKYFLDNPEECKRMGDNAAKKAKTITWDNFENKVMEAVKYAESAQINE